jgi:hypothetical protein
VLRAGLTDDHHGRAGGNVQEAADQLCLDGSGVTQVGFQTASGASGGI